MYNISRTSLSSHKYDMDKTWIWCIRSIRIIMYNIIFYSNIHWFHINNVKYKNTSVCDGGINKINHLIFSAASSRMEAKRPSEYDDARSDKIGAISSAVIGYLLTMQSPTDVSKTSLTSPSESAKQTSS